MEQRLANQNADLDLKTRRAQIRRRLVLANTAAIAILILVIGLSLGAVLQAMRAEHNAGEAARELARARQAEAHALLEQSEVRRRAGEAGQRLGSLAAVADAARLGTSAELRDEAIAALALPDLQFVPVWTNDSSCSFLQFSPSLGRLAVDESGGAIKLLNVQNTREQTVLHSIGSQVRRVWFSPDERFLAARYLNGSNVVWELATGAPLRAWDKKFSFIGFSSGSDQAFLADDSGVLRCVRLADGEQSWQCQSGGDITLLGAARRGELFALFLNDGPSVQVRDIRTGELVHEIPGQSPLGAFGWSSDGQTLVIGRQTGWIEVWDTRTWLQTTAWRAHDDTVVEVRCDPRGRWLASVSWDGTIRYWGLPDFRPLITAPGYYAHLIAQLSPDGLRFACSRGGNVFGFLVETPSPVLARILVAPGEGRGTWSVDVSPDGDLLAAGYEEGLRVFDLASGNQLVFQPVEDCRSALFAMDGRGLVTCGASGLAFWPIERAKSPGRKTVSLGLCENIRGGPLTYASLTADGEWVATGTAGDPKTRAIEVYNLHHPTNHFLLGTHARLQHIAVSPDGKWAASATWYGRGVKVWELASRREAVELPIEESAAVTFSPDSKLLVTSAREYRFWECGSWRERYRAPGIDTVLPPCAFSADGRLLAVLKGPRTIELRQASSGRILCALQSPGSSPLSVLRFTADGTRLAVLEWTRQIQVWNLTAMHRELAGLGLDEDFTPGARSEIVDGHSSVTSGQRTSGREADDGGMTSRAGAWFYSLTLAALTLGVAIGLYILRYHQRMMAGYDEVESVAADRNRELNAAQAELLHSQKMRALGTLAAGIAHDFNNLLSVIRMGNHMLGQAGTSMEEKAESNRAIESAVEQGRKIVRGMLGYSREVPDEPECYSVADVVNEAGLLLNQQFLRGITLTLELDKEVPLVAGRRARLQQILLNLIVNAAEAMNGEGRLRIAVRESRSASTGFVLKPGPASRYVQLVLEDTGAGIDPGICERVFEPFFSTKPRGASSGTGLGLSLVHSLAQQEGMGICLESTSGVGTTFTIWIPVAVAGTSSSTAAREATVTAA
jgi:signal transduction histidine kinase